MNRKILSPQIRLSNRNSVTTWSIFLFRALFPLPSTGLRRIAAAVCLALLGCCRVSAEPIVLGEHFSGSLGKQALFLVEDSRPLELAQAIRKQQQGEFRAGERSIATFGIGARPVWMYLELVNPEREAAAFHLNAGLSWIDHLHIYLVRDGKILQWWRSGDAHANPQYLVPGLGYLFPLQVPPGESALFIRAATADPFVLPVSLRPETELAVSESWLQYSHGILYGFLLAFICYNLMVYWGLRSPSYLFYALYLASFIALHLTYSGHGFAWWWPSQVGLQRYAILVMMLVFGCCGFLFASRFLQLQTHAPAMRRWVFGLSAAALLLMGWYVWRDSHVDAALLAFNFVLLFSAGMVVLGVITIRHGQQAGRYFLGAALCSMLGVASTALSVRGVIPMSPLTFHGVEIGLMLEATLLSLALASRMRQQEQARISAEQLARLDSLTGVLNRRALFDETAGVWSTAVRHRRPLSVLMLDIDHFKQINDQHGHGAGDRILAQVAQLLVQSCREGDLVARWGGEEFVIVLAETDLEQACLVAERIRLAIRHSAVGVQSRVVPLSVSLGAAQRSSHFSLEELIGTADRQLLTAKRQGRNRVCPVVAAVAELAV